MTTGIERPAGAATSDDTTLTPDDFTASVSALDGELRKLIVGQDELVRNTLIALFAEGHVLLEGVPGLGKTALVRAVGQALDLHFSRVQFTPDLMPADILGTTVIQESEAGRQFTFQPGPIFANLVLADEVNRATPKTQSALLEAMQERTVTAGNRTRPLPDPFFVLATQNPIELEGTYPLPEAQLDRFLFKLLVPFPSTSELAEIARRTTGTAIPQLDAVATGERVRGLIELAKAVPIADHVIDYAVRLVTATHPQRSQIAEVKDAVRFGASPRAVQSMVRAGKVRALMEKRYNVAFDDVRAVAKPVLRHRIFLSFEAEASGIDTDTLVDRLLEVVVAEPAAHS